MMKKNAFILLFAALLANCAKTRSCTCNGTSTIVTQTTPENGAATTTTNTYTDSYFYSLGHSTKKELKENSACIGQFRTKTETFTTSINTPTTYIISGIVVPAYITTTANVVRTSNYDSSCEIK